MDFPYENYETLAEPLTLYYPTGEETLARWVFQTIEKAGKLLTQLLNQPFPEIEILLVSEDDWSLAPRDESEAASGPPCPYWAQITSPPSLIIPVKLDPIFGEATAEKLAFILYHELALAFQESDPRPWPDDAPLWADEWQLTCIALWLSHSIDNQHGIINKDLHEKYPEIFEPEADGKTPITIRGFDWYGEETSPEDYLAYSLLLERFAADLLAHYEIAIVTRFLALYRVERNILLSDEVTEMLATALGPGSNEWLESLTYF